MKKIKIKFNDKEAIAELNDSETATKIFEALPIESSVNTWGDEIYFTIPVKLKEENAKEIVEKGDIAYWPPGSAFCIFFGLTPASTENEIRPASTVNVFGKIISDLKIFKDVKDGSKIRVEKLNRAPSLFKL